MKKEKVIKKVQAMLNLANDKNATEGEISNAMSMVKNILKKHDLEMSDIELEEEVSNMTSTYTSDFKRLYCWIKMVCQAIDLICDTQHIHTSLNRNKRFCFCGTKTDTVAALCMFNYLYETIQRMSKESKMFGMKEKNSYRSGVAFRLIVRATKIKRDSLENNEDSKAHESYALIVQSKESAVADYLQKEYNPKTKDLKLDPTDIDAFQEGLEDGADVSLASKNCLTG